MKRLMLSVVTAMAAMSLGAEVPQTHIYRTDGGFQRLEGDVECRHIDAGGIKVARFTGDGDPLSMEVAAIDHIDLRRTAVPRIHIDIPGDPGLTQVQEKELYLDALISIEGNGYIDDLAQCDVTVKGRGNSTWGMPKKPMRLKFDKKVSLGGMKKAKSYVLLANYIDPSLMRNAVAMWLAREFGIAWANHIVPCEVTFNGHDLGAFMLTEKVGIGGASVDIEEEEGILLELSTEYDEKYKFYSGKYHLPVMVKDPDFDELAEDNPSWGTPEEKLAQWRADYNQAESLVTQGRGFEAFDLDSFVDYVMLYNIVLNGEIGHPKSLYLHKERLGDDCKWMCGPVWDFDASFNLAEPSGNGFAPRAYDGGLWMNDMFDRLAETPGFIERYKERFAWFHAEIYPRMLDFVDEYALLVRPSAKVNGQLWSAGDNLGWCQALCSYDHEAHAAALRLWLTDRVAHLAALAAADRIN